MEDWNHQFNLQFTLIKLWLFDHGVARRNQYYILCFYLGVREKYMYLLFRSFRMHVSEVTCTMWLPVAGVKCLF